MLTASFTALDPKRKFAAPLCRPRQDELLGRRQPDMSRREGSPDYRVCHCVLMNELSGAALPSQKFGANAAWLRLNVIL